MSLSFLCGFLFACAGISLFLAQVAIMELKRAHRTLKHAIDDHYGHDTFVYPDHQAIEQPHFPAAMVRNGGGEW